MANKHLFDIGMFCNGLKEYARKYFCYPRGIGRTYDALESLCDGDVYVVASQQHAMHINQILSERNLNIMVVVASNGDVNSAFEKLAGRSITGEVVIDHDALCAIHVRGIATIQDDIARLIACGGRFEQRPKNHATHEIISAGRPD